MLKCQLMPDSLGDLGQVTFLSYLKKHFISEVGNNSTFPKRFLWGLEELIICVRPLEVCLMQRAEEIRAFLVVQALAVLVLL